MKKFDHLIPFQFKPAGTVSQLDMVRAELLSGARINDEQVHKKYGISRLAAVIYKLKNPSKARIKRGESPLPISSQLVEGRNRFGLPSKFSEYWLADQPSLPMK